MISRLLRPAAALALAFPFAVGCGLFTDPEARPVVTIGDREFTHAEFDEFVTARTAVGISADAALLSVLFDEFVRERLFLIAADEAGVEVSAMRVAAEVSALERLPGSRADGEESSAEGTPAPEPPPILRRQVRDRLRIERLLETEVLEDLAPSDEAARLEFESGLPFYARPETVSLSERAFDDRAAAEAALAEIRAAGEAGSEAAEEPAGEESAASDGFVPVGSFRRGELPESVSAVVFEAEAGAVTEVVETASGYRIYRVEERRPGGQLDFDEAEAVAQLTVLRREADARIAAFLNELRGRHPVEVHTARLRFPYVGRLGAP